MTKQAVIYFKNGTKDWIDPVEEGNIRYADDRIFIDNGYNIYEYLQSLVDRIEFEEI